MVYTSRPSSIIPYKKENLLTKLSPLFDVMLNVRFGRMSRNTIVEWTALTAVCFIDALMLRLRIAGVGKKNSKIKENSKVPERTDRAILFC
jgi:hypothetical protein